MRKNFFAVIKIIQLLILCVTIFFVKIKTSLDYAIKFQISHGLQRLCANDSNGT